MGAWIETPWYSLWGHVFVSLPIWERGLKQDAQGADSPASLSLPIWERGLKHTNPGRHCNNTLVAPYMGAWIET